MRKISHKLIILIAIINFIGMIFEGTTVVDNSITTEINNTAEKNTLETIKEKGEITVVAPLKDITYFYLDAETNKIRGIEADIISEISKRLGINKIEIKVSSFSDLLEKLNTDDNIDIATGGMYITPKREEIAAFTQPLYKDSEAIVVPTFSTINFTSDLKKSAVGVVKGTVYVSLAEKWKENNLIKDIVIFETTADLLNSVNSNKVDAAIVDSVIFKYSLLQDKSLVLRMLKDYKPEVFGVVGIAVRKNDAELLKALNEKISEMKADGSLYSILVDDGLDKDNMISH